MPGDKSYTERFKEQADTYSKFILYHIIIIFTIVFSLYNGVTKIQGEDIMRKADSVKVLHKQVRTGFSVITNDWLIQSMYFSNDEVSSGFKIDTSISQAEAAARQTRLVREIEDQYAQAFNFRLGFLGDVSVDLRVWIFILPVILFISLIYLFLLDLKMVLLKKTAAVHGEAISLTEQYPFNFIRASALLIESGLLIAYSNILYTFLKYSDDYIRFLILKAYAFLIYIAVVYCLSVAYKLSKADGQDVAENLLLYRWGRAIWRFLSGRRGSVGLYPMLGTGQALVLITLLLVMSTSTCDNHYTGYQIVTGQRKWEHLNSNMGNFYSLLYTATIAAALFAFCLYNYRSQKKLVRLISNFTGFYFKLIAAIYTFYFGIGWPFFDDESVYAGILLFMGWYFLLYKKKKTPERPGLFERSRFVLYLSPLIILAIANCLKAFTDQNGWIFYYCGIWIVNIAFLQYTRLRQTASSAIVP